MELRDFLCVDQLYSQLVVMVKCLNRMAAESVAIYQRYSTVGELAINRKRTITRCHSSVWELIYKTSESGRRHGVFILPSNTF